MKQVAVMAHTFNLVTREGGAGGSVSSRKDRRLRDILPQSKPRNLVSSVYVQEWI